MKSRNALILIADVYIFIKTGRQKNVWLKWLERPLFAVRALQTLVRNVLGLQHEREKLRSVQIPRRIFAVPNSHAYIHSIWFTDAPSYDSDKWPATIFVSKNFLRVVEARSTSSVAFHHHYLYSDGSLQHRGSHLMLLIRFHHFIEQNSFQVDILFLFKYWTISTACHVISC